MLLQNCFGSIYAPAFHLHAVLMTVLLFAIKGIYPRIAKKKLSPMLLIFISALLGIVVFGI